MGACDFTVGAKGATAKEAFSRAIEDARYERGHGGYTGTIAEKGTFVKLGAAKTKKEAYALAQQFMDDGDPRIDDKWGPAGCIEVEDTPDFWLFFGWASS
jgi:hypothetical protein